MSALTKGKTVLITGGTGWVGSHVAHEALAAGLLIRLAIRSEAKAKPLIEALEKIHGQGRIESVIVKDFALDGAYDEAIKGVQGVVHVASDVSFSSDPEVVIPAVLKSYDILLDAANQEKTVQRVVITTSSIALGEHNVDEGAATQHFDVDSWNDAAVQGVKTAPNPVNVYAASKVLSERAAFEYVKNKRPNFTVTSVAPAAVFGAPVPGTAPLSTAAWVVDASQGKENLLSVLGGQYHVDVDDAAKLHVIALTREDVKMERILAFGSQYNYNILLDTIKKIKPEALVEDARPEWDQVDDTIVDVSRANELLASQGGLRNFEYSIRRNLQAV